MKKILVIEDNFEVRDNLEEILLLSNYEVVTAEDGIIGVEKAIAESPDIIICDVMMPRLDGFGVLRILSQKPQTSEIPFIFLTAKAEQTDFRHGMNLGADDYITKPFQHTELLDAIEIRLKKTARLEKVFSQNPMEQKQLVSEIRGQKEFEKLAEARETRKYFKKEFIFREGDTPRRLFYIVKGKVKTFRTNDSGKELITGLFKPGDFMGYQAILKGAVYHENAALLEDSEIAFIPKEDFLELLEGSRDFSARFVKLLANNIIEKEEQLLKLAYNSIRKRVADALIKLNQKYKGTRTHEINILRDDLASLVGTAKESISRMLTDFKSEKLIEITPQGNIKILDEQALKDLPN